VILMFSFSQFKFIDICLFSWNTLLL
jgi:hypothetical protein